MIFLQDEIGFAGALGRLEFCNPFLPERIELEREALGEKFLGSRPVWSAEVGGDEGPNLGNLLEKAQGLVEAARGRLATGQRPSEREAGLYEDLVYYVLYQQTREALDGVIGGRDARRVRFYAAYAEQYRHYFSAVGGGFAPRYPPERLFAFCFQIRRAFALIFRQIVGGSMPIARLRAAVWQSIFTSDMRRYFQMLYDRMADFATLIRGASGTGKELVASAIGKARFIPFDVGKGMFEEEFASSFYALNISALSPTLVESELFGHRRGAFTGALEERAGWLELCKPVGTVFLDEVGEIEPAIQVKLLRVLQGRTFSRLGESTERTFSGKIAAATNRDLERLMREGKFREDFYYRLCSDLIVTPSLREILGEAPSELAKLVLFITRRIMGRTTEEVDEVGREIAARVESQVGSDYGWPGNFRELEQCVRNILVRGEYHPPRPGEQSVREMMTEALWEGRLTADRLLSQYCTLIQSRTDNYEETARRLRLDRRTVKAKVDPKLMEELRG